MYTQTRHDLMRKGFGVAVALGASALAFALTLA